MNKKLKKALYMLGFALPIVAIPIITVACGTQTSQITPKEADKNQNEQTPKQELPIQDQNKRVTVSSNLFSSKIYDERLLNSNVIELFKLFNKYSFVKLVKEKFNKNTLENQLYLKKHLKELNEILEAKGNIETHQHFLNVKEQVEKIISKLKEIDNLIDTTTDNVINDNLKKWANQFIKEKNEDDDIEDAQEVSNNEIASLVYEAEELINSGKKTIEEGINYALSKISKIPKEKDEFKEELKDEDFNENILDNLEKEAVNETIDNAIEYKKDYIDIAVEKTQNIREEIKTLQQKLIMEEDELSNKINKEIINLYKKIFSIKLNDDTNFSELKYNDFLSKFSEVKLINFFNIENFKKHLENLTNDNKLNEIALKDIFNKNINSIIESLKKDQNKNIKLLDFKKEQENKIIELLDQNNPELSNKIKDKLSNLTNFESFESLLKDLIFSDLFDINKLQEKLNQ